ncbi:nucleotide-binding domain-containing protein [Gigaspora rosea]|uniref:Nucleotide-binding domain-containing protein n=1 Tax=Gigaspora rosea TaxID=44941 RepID=A0A397U739_9GLOM|nr:nucleotide-binding domain-containing protein [Gigaspora rosea]
MIRKLTNVYRAENAYNAYNKLLSSHGTLKLSTKKFSSLSNSNNRQNFFNSSLRPIHQYMRLNFSSRFASTNVDEFITRRKRRRRLIFFSTFVIIGTALLVELDYRTSESQAKEQEEKTIRLCTRKGGPKGLVIAEHFTDEKDYENTAKRPRLVILGSGWGAISLIKGLDKKKYHVTIISPQNYFLFTPLLPSATVGTLEARSLLEPVRSIIKGVDAHYVEAKATDVVFDEKLVEVTSGDDPNTSFYIPYDKLVIAVGSESITHGIEGIEHCHTLKSINDARLIRKKIMDNFEKATLPTTSPEERKRLLSFVVCGGGVEFAAEIYDFLTEDVVKYFPTVLRNEVQVSIIQSSDHILNTYDEKISDFAEKKFKRDHINVITNARVQKVESDHLVYKMKNEQDSKNLDYGLCLWSTGIAMNPLTKAISNKLPEQQNKRALVTDSRLRLKGIQDSSVYAIGDCSTIENPNLVQGLMKFFNDADLDKNGQLTYDEFAVLATKIARKYPLTANHLKRAHELFDRYDVDKSGTLELDELRFMLEEIDKKFTSLPATAQVANQQGKYLGKKLNQLVIAAETSILPSSRDYSEDSDSNCPDTDDKLAPFEYAHLGSMAYIGNAAVADFGMGWTWMGGLSAVYLWRSVYFSEQVSLRTRVLLAFDWTKRSLFGRDISKF